MSHHYKKDGTLDMRYSSSKAAISSGFYSGVGSSFSGFCGSNSYSSGSSSRGLHYKKDGTPDMRYSSSKAAVASEYGSTSTGKGSDLHYKKDGSLDMRYKSSREAESRLNSAITKISHSTRNSKSHSVNQIWSSRHAIQGFQGMGDRTILLQLKHSPLASKKEGRIPRQVENSNITILVQTGRTSFPFRS